MAQPGSALAWGASGRWFESSPPDSARRSLAEAGFFNNVSSAVAKVLADKRAVAQPGSALRSGRRGRWFESSLPDKKKRLQVIKLEAFFYGRVKLTAFPVHHSTWTLIIFAITSRYSTVFKTFFRPFSQSSISEPTFFRYNH